MKLRRFAGLLLGIGTFLTSPGWAASLPGATLLGKAAGKGRCGEGLGQVWIAQGKQLLFHAEVPVRAGEFEFRLLPGTYQVTVTTRSGCMDEKKVEIKLGVVNRVTLAPVSPL